MGLNNGYYRENNSKKINKASGNSSRSDENRRLADNGGYSRTYEPLQNRSGMSPASAHGTAKSSATYGRRVSNAKSSANKPASGNTNGLHLRGTDSLSYSAGSRNAAAPSSADRRKSTSGASAYRGSSAYGSAKNGKHSSGGFVFLIIVLLAVIAATVFLALNSNNNSSVNDITAETPAQSSETEAVTDPPETEEVWKPSYVFYDGMYSREALLYDYTDDKLLAEIGADEIIYPASLTKMMTVLVAIENISDLSLETTLSTEMFAYLLEQNASIAGFSENEKVNARDLLYASMLPSGADGSIGLAQIVSGSESAYVALMNKKAAELDMNDTHYMNATGLHDPNHYTTAEDQLKLMKYAMKNDEFRKVITAQTYTSASTPQHPQGITMYSTLFKSIQANSLENKYIIGGKTGYTPEAGLCLASIAEINGHTYFLITFGAGAGSNTPGYHTMDAVAIFDDYAVVSSSAGTDTAYSKGETPSSSAISDKAP